MQCLGCCGQGLKRMVQFCSNTQLYSNSGIVKIGRVWAVSMLLYFRCIFWSVCNATFLLVFGCLQDA